MAGRARRCRWWNWFCPRPNPFNTVALLLCASTWITPYSPSLEASILYSPQDLELTWSAAASLVWSGQWCITWLLDRSVFCYALVVSTCRSCAMWPTSQYAWKIVSFALFFSRKEEHIRYYRIYTTVLTLLSIIALCRQNTCCYARLMIPMSWGNRQGKRWYFVCDDVGRMERRGSEEMIATPNFSLNYTCIPRVNMTSSLIISPSSSL